MEEIGMKPMTVEEFEKATKEEKIDQVIIKIKEIIGEDLDLKTFKSALLLIDPETVMTEIKAFYEELDEVDALGEIKGKDKDVARNFIKKIETTY